MANEPGRPKRIGPAVMKDDEENGHEDSIFYASDDPQILKDIVAKIARDICAEKDIPIKIDEYICEEALARAKETLQFHKTKRYSPYKEVAHVGYWLNRLKPLRIDSPMNIFRVMDAARTALNEWTKGKWISLEQRALDEEHKLANKLDLPINEMVVVTLVMDLIEAAQIAHARQVGGALGMGFEQAIKDNRERVPWLKTRLETSLRDHNHSARGFATLVEAAFRTRFEPN